MTANKKPVIEDVVTSAETLAALNSILSRSYVDKHRIIRNYAGGNCTSCRGIPNKKVIYDVNDGDKLVDKRLQKINLG